MKAKLVPVYFKRDATDAFSLQTERIRSSLSDCVELLAPSALGDPIDEKADAVVFPEILGEAYESSRLFDEIPVPILILTSEFMTISMWDWEIIGYLQNKEISVLAPYHGDQTRIVCRSLAVRRTMKDTTFLIFQDNPGEGFQPAIFKSFYWWKEECTEDLKKQLGPTIQRQSLKALGSVEQSIPHEEALKEVGTWDFPMDPRLSQEAKIAAAKYYLAVRKTLGSRSDVGGIGANCLNESHFSSSTPCIAWNLFFERFGILWSCEGDTLSLALKYLLYHSLQVPLLMTNIYPVLMGMAALKHEGIPNFPEILDEPENYVLLAHCGYFGLAPQSFCSHWNARPPVLGIVDKNAHALDVRFPTGAVTMVKLDPSMKRLMVIQGTLTGYVQYPGSDCRNGAMVKVKDGHRLMKEIGSHHQLILQGDQRPALELIAQVFGLTMECR